MENLKYITLESDLKRKENLTMAIQGFQEVQGRYDYSTNKENRKHLRKSEKRLKRLNVVIEKKKQLN